MDAAENIFQPTSDLQDSPQRSDSVEEDESNTEDVDREEFPNIEAGNLETYIVAESPLKQNYESSSSIGQLYRVPSTDQLSSSENLAEFESESNTTDDNVPSTWERKPWTSTETQLDWINLKFAKLMADRRRKPSNNLESTSSGSRTINDIIREYSVDSSSLTRGSPRPHASQSCRVSRSCVDSLHTRWMNISQNNETLDSSDPGREQLRRIGSSVDAGVGDMINALYAKSSFASMKQERSEDFEKSVLGGKEDDQPPREQNESDVDAMSPFSLYSSETTDIVNDLPSLSMTFQKERERLRNIETLIQRTPTSSTHDIGSWNSQYDYSSRYMPSSSLGKRAFSSTDYTSSDSEWRTPASDRTFDISTRTASTPSYGYSGMYSTPARAKLYTSRFDEDSTASHYQKPSSSRSKVAPKATARNRQNNAKTDKSVSKSEIHQPKQRNAPTECRMTKSSVLDNKRSNKERDSVNCNFNRTNCTGSQPKSSSRSFAFEVLGTEVNKSSRTKCKPSKYELYKPNIPENQLLFPQRKKGEQASSAKPQVEGANPIRNLCNHRRVLSASDSNFLLDYGHHSDGASPQMNYVEGDKQMYETLTSQSENMPCQNPESSVQKYQGDSDPSLPEPDEISVDGNDSDVTVDLKSNAKPKLKKTSGKKKKVTKRPWIPAT